MRNNKFLAALTLGLTLSGSVLAQTPSGSQLFQIGSESTITSVSSSAVSFTVPVAGGGLAGIAPNESGANAITLLAGGGSFSGPGTYVVSDGAGNVVTIAVGEDGKIVSISEGDTTQR